ncbi:hypothetical protein [Demequina sp. NBRC 110056]|uniref:hypothetical protein n=1 Tax=Demequina sp. NBRC 110056 TaxID=1570345 RepID=UPI000A077758|nr:hypothetical protein [Demequina sp. NBRC 110056]
MPEPLSPAAAWRQKAIRVVRSAAGPAVSELALGTVRLRPDATFAQHGMLGAKDALMIHVGVQNEGNDVAPLPEIDVTFEIPDAQFDESGTVRAGWITRESEWTFSAARIVSTAAISLSFRGLLGSGATAEAVLGVLLAPDARPAPIELWAHGRVAPDRLAQSTSLTIPVTRIGD